MKRKKIKDRVQEEKILGEIYWGGWMKVEGEEWGKLNMA
jgi:hypothetical protein